MAQQATRNLYSDVLRLHPHSYDVSRTACIIFPGVQSTRIREVNWQDYSATVWVAGTRGDPTYTSTQILQYLGRHEGIFPHEVRMQLYAKHTPEQALWATELLRQNVHVEHVVLSTAQYHCARALLTFLKTWLHRGDGRELRLSVLPTSNPTAEEVVKATQTSTSLEEELERIEKYQQQGDVATSDEFYTFIRTHHAPQEAVAE